MKKILSILMVLFGLAQLGCSNPLVEIEDTEIWQRLAGSAGIGFWVYGNDLENPTFMLVFIRTSFASRIELWEGRELIRSAEWLGCTENTIIYRAPDGQIIIQTYTIINNGLWIDESPGIIWGGVFWRRERPSWWSWEFPDFLPTISGSSHNLTGRNGIGFWGAGSDPNNPEHILVFINTSSVTRVEYWRNQQLDNWGHWLDAIGNTILYRRHDYLNPVTQRYRIEGNNRLWLYEHHAAMVWGGIWWRFEAPEWWTLEYSQPLFGNHAYPYRIYITGE